MARAGGDEPENAVLREVWRDVLRRDPHQEFFHSDVRGVLRSIGPVLVEHPEYTDVVGPALRARAGRRLPGPVGRRQRAGAGQPRVPRPVQLRARPVQGRSAVRAVGRPRRRQVPRLRAGVQERPDRPGHRWRQGRRGRRPEGAVDGRAHAVLPVVRHRAGQPRRGRGGRPRRGHGRRLPARSAGSTASTSASSATTSPARSPASPRCSAAPRCGPRRPATAPSTSPAGCSTTRAATSTAPASSSPAAAASPSTRWPR